MRFRCARAEIHLIARAGAACAVALCVVTMASAQASAHSWYPKKCCNELDCFPATKVRRLPDNRLEITAGHITVIIPEGFPARISQDNNTHVCVYRDMRGRYHPRCLFLPGVG